MVRAVGMHLALLHKGRTIQVHLNPHIGVFKGFEEFISGFTVPNFDVPRLLHSTKIVLYFEPYESRITPERNIELREEHPWIIPGYHMNKQHWNTVIAEEYASGAIIQELIQTSYNLVWQKLPKKVREGGL